MVVDDAVQVVEADPPRAPPAISGHAVTRRTEASQPLHVDVQERPRPRPLVAPRRRRGRLRAGREAVAAEHLPDRRAGSADDPGQAARPVARLPPRTHDRSLVCLAEPPRADSRPTRAIDERDSRPPLAPQVAMPPAMRGGGRDAECGRGGSQRETALDRKAERIAPGRSELGVSVEQHLALLLAVVFARRTAFKEGRTLPQPFTTCVGDSPRPRAGARGHPDDHLVGYPKTRATGTCNTEKGARGEPKAAALAAPSARLEDLRSEVRWLVAV